MSRKLKVTGGSGNVFGDIGFDKDEAENLKLRAELMMRIEDCYRKSGVPQAAMAAVLGLTDPARAAAGTYMTMVHELVHFREKSHDADFVGELQRVLGDLEISGKRDEIRERLLVAMTKNAPVLKLLHEAINDSNSKARGDSLPSRGYERISADESSDFVPVGDRAERIAELPGIAQGRDQRAEGNNPPSVPREPPKSVAFAKGEGTGIWSISRPALG